MWWKAARLLSAPETVPVWSLQEQRVCEASLSPPSSAGGETAGGVSTKKCCKNGSFEMLQR